jgi:hypothetical protein
VLNELMSRWRLRRLLAALAIVCGAALVSALFDGSSGDSSAAPQQASRDYLPLAVGHRWELRSRAAGEPMVLEVIDREGNTFVVRWINPWIEATFRFQSRAGRMLLVGLDMGQGNAPIPEDTVYWDFSARRGQRWKTAIGAGEVSDGPLKVNTPAGDYGDAIEVRTIDQQGQSMYWTFAPDVGLVRWGRGRDAYLLTSFRRDAVTAPSSAAPSVVPRPAPDRRTDGDRLLIGLDANPNDRHGGGRRAKRAALEQAWEAGMTLLHSAPKWDEFEKSAGKYRLTDDAEVIGEFAREKNLPIALCFRVIDTNQRSMPKPYERWRFDEERTAERLRLALRALPQVYKERTRYIAIGNEVNEYFNSRRGEIQAYALLLQRVRDTVRQEFPQAQFTVNYTFSATANAGQYRAITDLTEIASFTYYPLNGDFTMRDASAVRGDIRRMLDVSGGRKLYIQEIGYASAERLKSSPERQAEFYRNAFAALRDNRERIVGATFLFMSDFSDSIVNMLGAYYGAANSDNFKAYLQTLGIVERNGAAKPAFDVFRREAAALKNGR